MRIVTVPVLLLVVLGPAQAQVLPQRGSRVRVTSPVLKSGKEPGVVVAIRGDTMLLARDFPTGTVRIPVASIEQLELSTGTYRPILRTAGTGLAVGAAAGLLLSTIDSDGPKLLSEGDAAVLGMVAVGTAGALLGGIIGALTVNDRWEAFPMSGIRGQARVAPTLGGVGIHMSLGH